MTSLTAVLNGCSLGLAVGTSDYNLSTAKCVVVRVAIIRDGVIQGMRNGNDEITINVGDATSTQARGIVRALAKKSTTQAWRSTDWWL